MRGSSRSSSKPDGTWLVDVLFDSGIAFQELLNLHHNGTVTENNTALNPMSAGAPPFLTGLDGQGTWQRTPGGNIDVYFYKLVFCGNAVNAGQLPADSPPPPCAAANKQPGEFYGFLRVRFTANVAGNDIDSPHGSGETVLIAGADPLAAPVLNFGPFTATGMRLEP